LYTINKMNLFFHFTQILNTENIYKFIIRIIIFYNNMLFITIIISCDMRVNYLQKKKKCEICIFLLVGRRVASPSPSRFSILEGKECHANLGIGLANSCEYCANYLHNFFLYFFNEGGLVSRSCSYCHSPVPPSAHGSDNNIISNVIRLCLCN
jgi:hypothetical protein